MYADGMENSMKKYSVYKSLREYYSICCFGGIFQKGIISKKKSPKSSHPNISNILRLLKSIQNHKKPL